MKGLKDFKHYFILIPLIYIIFGGILLFMPEASLKLICYVLGSLAIIYGLVNTIGYFSSNEEPIFYNYELVSGIAGIIGGIFVILQSELIIEILPILLGILLLLDAAIKLQHAMDLRRVEYKSWGIILGMSLLLATLGILMILQPFQLAKIMVQFIGTCLILDGLINIWSNRCITHIIHMLDQKKKREEEQNL